MNAIFAVSSVPCRVLERRHYLLLALLFAAIAVYGSLVPLRPHPLPFAEAIARFRQVLARPIGLPSRSDWLANVLLVVPVSFFLMGALCCDRPHLAWAVLPFALMPCFLFSVAIEFAQLYFPPRVSSVNDVIAQIVGSSLGALFWLASGQRLTGFARRLWNEFGARNTASLLLPLYFFGLILLQTLPFDFTLSPVEVYHKYKEGRVHLLPFATSGVGGFELANKHFWNAMYFAPLGMLLAYWPNRVWRSGRSWPRVLGLGLLFAGFIELMQLFVFSRHFDLTDVLTGGPAVLAGWFLAVMYSRWLAGGDAVRWPVLAVWIGVLIYLEWQPFDFSLALGSALARLRQVSLLPFLDYYGGNYLHGLDEFLHKALMFFPIGLLLAPAAPAWSRAGLCAWLAAVCIAVVMEAGQLFLPTRYASVSDVLVGSAAAWMGILVACRLRIARPVESVRKGLVW